MDTPKHRDYLRYQCYRGLLERFGRTDGPERERVDYELSIIIDAGFSAYFLIVWDLMKFARESGIPVGPGRGSVCGSMVAYVLRITDVQPIEHGIPFARFLHLDRVALPDIDIDVCQARRHEIIEYLYETYERENVAGIITFGALQAKQVVLDVCRIFWVDHYYLDGARTNKIGERLAAMIPEGSGADQIVLKDWIDTDAGSAFKAEISGLEVNGISILDQCLRLEGLKRHGSVHAAGVVIGDRPLVELVPLYRKNKDADIQTQYDYKDAEAIGLLKLDILGLRTVTVMGDAEAMIRKREPDFSLSSVPIDDDDTFDLLRRGKTLGVFQLEGDQITNACQGVKPDCFKDVVALIALFRPGPMEQLGTYIDRKNGKAPVVYDHPVMEEVLSDTYGLIVYQEQTMNLAVHLAGYTPGEADMLRKAIGKKLPTLIAEQMAEFKERAIERGHDETFIDGVVSQIAYFGRYGFNRGHATGYGYITYWTAYLKAHYPVEFYAASLNSYIGELDRIRAFVRDAELRGIRFLPPDINESVRDFTPAGSDSIRFGLSAVRGVGRSMVIDILEERDGPEKNRYSTVKETRMRRDGTEYVANVKAVERIPHEGREFADIYDFCSRLTRVPINVKHALVVSGAFGVDPDFRRKLCAVLPDLNKAAKAGRKAPTKATGPLKSVFSLMAEERDTLGLYVSGHPLDFRSDLLDLYGAIWKGDFADLGAYAKIAGVVSDIRTYQSRRGEMAWITLDNLIEGSPDVTVFNDQWAKADIYRSMVVVVDVQKKYDKVRGWNMVAQRIWIVDGARVDVKRVHISVPNTEVADIVKILDLAGEGGPIVHVAVEDLCGRIALVKAGFRLPPLTMASLGDLIQGWEVRLDPDGGAELPWGSGFVAKSKSPYSYMASKSRREAIWDLSAVRMFTGMLGGTIIAELERVDQ